MTAAEQVERDAKIASMFLSGVPFERVAVECGVSERNARLGYTRWRDSDVRRTLDGENPLDTVRDHVARLEALYSSLALVVLEADTPGAKTGAIAQQLSALRDLLALRQAAGLLPKNLGHLRVELDIRHVAKVLVEVLDEYDFPQEGRRKVLSLLEGEGADAR